MSRDKESSQKEEEEDEIRTSIPSMSVGNRPIDQENDRGEGGGKSMGELREEE